MNVTQFFMLGDRSAESEDSTAGVDEAEIGKIQPGMPVTFTVDSYAGHDVHGHRRRRAPERVNPEQRRHLSGLDQGDESGSEAAAEHDGHREDPYLERARRRAHSEHGAAVPSDDDMYTALGLDATGRRADRAPARPRDAVTARLAPGGGAAGRGSPDGWTVACMDDGAASSGQQQAQVVLPRPARPGTASAATRTE